jgi:radical SAM protein with 4Fe4S-binding SPASM domain
MSCPHIPELSYSEFGRGLLARLGGRRYPLAGSIELTMRCNLRCAHCYVQCDADAWASEPELTTAEVCGILDQLAEAGCLWLLLTGGEPLTRPDFAEIYLHAKRRGFLLTLFTNGTLVTDEIAALLAAYPPHAVEVSLYGRTAAVYERVTGAPGSFARCMAGIARLAQLPAILRLKTPVMTLNAEELWDVKAYAESLGAPFRFDPMINAGLSGGREPLPLRLTPEEIVALELQDEPRMQEWRRFCERFVGVKPEANALYVCGAGWRSFHIDAMGRLGLCILARRPHYDLRRGSFAEGWEAALPQERARRPERHYDCLDCSLLSLCGQCPGWAEMESGCAEEPVSFLCAVAHARAQALGISLEGARLAAPLIAL